MCDYLDNYYSPSAHYLPKAVISAHKRQPQVERAPRIDLQTCYFIINHPHPTITTRVLSYSAIHLRYSLYLPHQHNPVINTHHAPISPPSYLLTYFNHLPTCLIFPPQPPGPSPIPLSVTVTTYLHIYSIITCLVDVPPISFTHIHHTHFGYSSCTTILFLTHPSTLLLTFTIDSNNPSPRFSAPTPSPQTHTYSFNCLPLPSHRHP